MTNRCSWRELNGGNQRSGPPALLWAEGVAGNPFKVAWRRPGKRFDRPVAALDEIHRVLRSGGRASIFDLRKDAPREAIDREIRDMHLSALSTLITKWIFRYGLLRAAYTRDALEAVVARSRFGRGEIRQDGIGFELRLQK